MGWSQVFLQGKRHINAFSRGLPEEAWEDVFCNNALGLYGLRIEQETNRRLVRVVES